MNWHTRYCCVRPGCTNEPKYIRLMTHTKYNFIYPMSLCSDCVNFLQLEDNTIGCSYTS